MKAKSMEQLADAVVSMVKQALAPRDARIAQLEQRLAALETKPSVKFAGVWKPDTEYVVGSAATHQGALWICKATTRGEPGKDYTSWQLAVKRGQA